MKQKIEHLIDALTHDRNMAEDRYMSACAGSPDYDETAERRSPSENAIYCAKFEGQMMAYDKAITKLRALL